MKLKRTDRVYAHFTFADLEPTTVASAKFGDETDWHELEGTGLVRKLLIAGPEFDTPGAAVVIPSSCTVEVRFQDDPEDFTRDADRITLT